MHKKGFQLRIMFTGILCAVIAVILTAASLYKITENTSRDLSKELMSGLVDQISLNVDQNIRQIQDTLINITLDDKVIEILSESNQDRNQVTLQENRELQNKVMQTQLINNSINGLYLFDKNGVPYYSGVSPSFSQDYDITTESWYKMMPEHRGVLMLPYGIPERYLIDKTPVVSMVQQIQDYNTGDVLATIIVDIREDMFEQITETKGTAEKYFVLIIDSNNNLVYSNSDNGLMLEYLKHNGDIIDSDYGSFWYDTGNDNIFAQYKESTLTNWTTVCYADVDKITGISEQVKPLAIILATFIGIITALAFIIVTLKQFRVLNILREGMSKIQEGDYNFIVPISSKDEIGVLASTFNDMTNRLNYLVNTVSRLELTNKQKQLELVQAELKTLQAQINPHFINNSLQMIAMMAELNDDTLTQQMATILGRLIQYSMRPDQNVALEEELEHVNDYLQFQKICLQENLEVVIEAEDSTKSMLIPRLILQPLAENSIIHGLNGISNPKIIIKAEAKYNVLAISVMDNGRGISSDELEKLQKELLNYNVPQGKHGIGIANINRRIHLLFPSKTFGLSIQSTEGVGTKVVLKVPASKSSGEDYDKKHNFG